MADLNCATGCPFFCLEENQDILEKFLAGNLDKKVDAEGAINHFSDLVSSLIESEKCEKCSTLQLKSDFLKRSQILLIDAEDELEKQQQIQKIWRIKQCKDKGEAA